MKEENIYLSLCLLLKLLSETERNSEMLALWSSFELLPLSYSAQKCVWGVGNKKNIFSPVLN